MKIGILGGTFSPIHDGHLRLAKTYQQELGLEKMLLIPTYQPPHKHTDHLPDGEHRCRMAELASEGFAGFEVSDIEIRRGGKSYTVDTLEELRQLYPDGEFYLLTGSDMFCTVLDWHRGAELVKLAEICTMERGGDTAEMLEAQAERIRAVGGRHGSSTRNPLTVPPPRSGSALPPAAGTAGNWGSIPRCSPISCRTGSMAAMSGTGSMTRQSLWKQPAVWKNPSGSSIR